MQYLNQDRVDFLLIQPPRATTISMHRHSNRVAVNVFELGFLLPTYSSGKWGLNQAAGRRLDSPIARQHPSPFAGQWMHGR